MADAYGRSSSALAGPKVNYEYGPSATRDVLSGESRQMYDRLSQEASSPINFYGRTGTKLDPKQQQSGTSTWTGGSIMENLQNRGNVIQHMGKLREVAEANALTGFENYATQHTRDDKVRASKGLLRAETINADVDPAWAEWQKNQPGNFADLGGGRAQALSNQRLTQGTQSMSLRDMPSASAYGLREQLRAYRRGLETPAFSDAPGFKSMQMSGLPFATNINKGGLGWAEAVNAGSGSNTYYDPTQGVSWDPNIRHGASSFTQRDAYHPRINGREAAYEVPELNASVLNRTRAAWNPELEYANLPVGYSGEYNTQFSQTPFGPSYSGSFDPYAQVEGYYS
jgi:hypothetical protein